MAGANKGETFEKELKKLIDEKEKELAKVIGHRMERRDEELRIIGTVEDIIEKRCALVTKSLMSKGEPGTYGSPMVERRPHTFLEHSPRGDDLNPSRSQMERYPHIYEIELMMPRFAEIASVNLLFRSEFNVRSETDMEIEGPELCLRTYHKYPDAKLEQKAILEISCGQVNEEDVDDFVRGAVLGFIESWYARRIGQELARDREYEVKITLRPHP